MRVVRKIRTMQSLAKEAKRKGKVIGFVPTMGYLHEGHLSLVRIARKRSDLCVVSIFVNPLQFGPKEDFKEYPRDIKRDKKLLAKEKVDILFYPDEKEMYPDNYATYIKVERLTEGLCGRSRPGHFQGVTTVVGKLFNIVMPDISVFGQKDAQQAFVIKRMVRDLNLPVKIIVAPTVREKDGLAMSSRNIYLTPKEREEAVVLYRSLMMAKEMIEKGERNPNLIIGKMREMIEETSGKIDYISIVDTKELREVDLIKGEVLIALAVYFGKARLIDNIILRV
jgi:pantoate--beta-alanine ligase|uniref:Pantothenate synthetase n=1 Tax=candidate division WOR-3 bacterium TaxID=2052148 RepID=A0A7C3UUP5_UNCW3